MLPSVLAMRDMRRKLRRHFGLTQPDRDALVRLLALDPLATLRGLRSACAPMYGAAETPWNLRRLCDELGASLSRRLLDVAAADVTGTSLIRQLWLHSLATACAAERLAQELSIMAPEDAYLLGLLNDLPYWLELLGMRSVGMPITGTAREWAEHWRLPQSLIALYDEDTADAPRPGVPPTDAATLVRAAEFIAELADFKPPALLNVALPEVTDEIGRDEFVAAQKVRQAVAARLAEFGLPLDASEPDTDLELNEPDDSLAMFRRPPTGDSSEVVLSILSCSKSGTYRGTVTAVTAAALRYLGFDRAQYVKWLRPGDRVCVRAKADLSSRTVPATTLRVTASELNCLQQALANDHPVRVERAQMHSGLLHWAGCDEALLIAVNREFASPSFLLLDMAMSSRPLQRAADLEATQLLGCTASLLNENLMLKRLRQRAEKYALTDPLTRLANRAQGLRSVEQELSRSRRSGKPLSLLMLDLDEFKKLNDRFGHQSGDLALRTTADVLRRTLRKSDIICRYGGEEFVVALPETGPEEASVLAARLFTAIEEAGALIQMPLTTSIGLSAAEPGDTMSDMVHRADEALYASKSLGRNRFSTNIEI